MTTPTPLAETSTLQAPYWNGSQWVRDVASPEEILAGDTLLVMVGGGNKVDSYPGGVWQQINYQTGQEAQGFVMAATFTSDQGFPTWTLAFDGTDKSMVSVVHLRVPDVQFMVDDYSREGSVGVTRPAEDLPLTGAGKDDTEYYLAFVRNSGGAYPTSGDADTVYALSNGNEGAALFRRQPTADATTTLALPSCTGHYAVAVGLYVPAWGDWQDSVEFWDNGPGTDTLDPSWDADTSTTSNAVVQSSTYSTGTSPQDAADHVWAGTGAVNFTAAPSSGDSKFELQDTTPIGSPGRYRSSWVTLFATIARASGHLGVFTGVLPDTVYDPDTAEFVDPTVIDIEWETDPDPVGQRLQIHAETSPLPGSDMPTTRNLYSFYAVTEDLDATLGPTSFVGPGTIQGGTLLFTTTLDNIDDSGVLNITIDDYDYEGGLLGDPGAALRLRVAALDHTTQTGTAFTPPTTTTGAQLRTFSLDLQQLYRPRFRLLYRHGAVVTSSVVRLYPRDDTLGIGGPNRIVPTPRANRIIGQQP